MNKSQEQQSPKLSNDKDLPAFPKSKKKTFQSLLKEYGFKKMPWNKCPKGFEEANYPCYSHEENNVWVELYLGDRIPYGWMIGPNHSPRGKFFENPKQLDALLSHLSTPEK